MGLCVGFGLRLGFKRGGRLEDVVDDDEVVVPAGGQGDGVVAVFVVDEVDGVVGVGDGEPPEEAGNVEVCPITSSPYSGGRVDAA